MNAQLPEPSPDASGLSADARSDEPTASQLADRALYAAYSDGRKDEREEWMPVLEALKDLRQRFHAACIHSGSDAWAADASCKQADAAIAKVTQ